MQKVIKQKKGYYKEQFPNIVRKFTLTLHSFDPEGKHKAMAEIL